MSKLARWSYTAKCTIWRYLGLAENGDASWSGPEIIMCDYQGGISAKIGSLGTEIVVKNTFWSEFSEAKKGDYILIGKSDIADPTEAGADEIMQVIRYADTFYRQADDFAIITGV
ncbi:hypothetical protein [Klebsiella sp. BIGb0407]|uniref:hypothetical protein n=1 Tax=Klebsiella sp. BIGb0407 TaxID=2940603 RepID=UPI0021677F21|nr:hypothetical protein [Klebsiella sp. BIGb0407]MCS3430032.1 hypothetical protein [Klebsiella sp. BIGb0407]